ncbi:magnesium transporter MgtE N-terminal domain-containing protein [Nonomuraea lactucae]|uniref:magnesium transporter MgtE N-terminal domain-containing protein n=1 Tax=Nonomuraea lactucae TaxID=2249762 RepID=UPI000DE46980|nr:hypothetical protein [Nonomuraea lactucae]
MLGGRMPVAQLVTMVHGLPARQAADLLMSLPADRLDATLAAMRLADIVKVLEAVQPDRQDGILAKLSPEQIAGLLRSVPAGQAARLLSSLPRDRIVAVAKGLPASEVPMLLEVLRPEHQEAVLEAMDPQWAGKVVARRYERGVAQALARTNVKVASLDGGQSDALLVEVLDRFIVVTVHHHEHGLLTLHDLRKAEETAHRTQARGALAVSNVPLSREVVEYHREALRWGRLINAVTWVDPSHDGLLARMLVGLVR